MTVITKLNLGSLTNNKSDDDVVASDFADCLPAGKEAGSLLDLSDETRRAGGVDATSGRGEGNHGRHLSSAPTYRRPDLPLCPTRLFDPRSGHDDLAHAGRTNFESLCFTQLSPLVQQLVTCRRQPPVADTLIYSGDCIVSELGPQ